MRPTLLLSTPFKRAQLGLFHGKTRQTGNSVPFSKSKTKRAWLPNVHSKRLTSDVLGEEMKLKVTTRALKTIKKHGSLDQYLLRTKADLLGWQGMKLRVQLEEKMKENELNQQKLPKQKVRVPPPAKLPKELVL
ncbi:hypothetical protein JAAARDRAFT_40916 [Jaapia argillacea MUCL 33604]|uniref:Large ribosomal subunit protein bL28m n=1 Tax=Jaapia argillacea MUCL 33604 TaxID=933084 RepID=A0A067PA80_9AGAM|nr:hypothetical protein JAAARDRAFT_40916 [Jaapia argillacea MUCL 33604]